MVFSHGPLIKIDGRYLLAGDGIKVSKEAEKMPGEKGFTRNQTTPARLLISMVTIMGSSVFWPVGLKKIFCVPLAAELHEGVETLRNFQGKPQPAATAEAKTSVTTLMAAMVCDLVSCYQGKLSYCLGCLLCLRSGLYHAQKDR